MKNHREVHDHDMKHDPAYREAYEALHEEFALVSTLIKARTLAKLSQADLAVRMGTTESAISRLESGRFKPSTRTLERYAHATGHKLSIRFEPVSTSF
jgi:ribosome-binding protein aMBF1 (putative translation factor)